MPCADPPLEALRERVLEAADRAAPLEIVGGGSKRFYGREPQGEPLSTVALSGIVRYQPSELFVTVRAGTPLAQLEATLAAEGQMLAFEPPHFGPGATVGGMVAAGLAGPRRPWTGAVRDHLLGVRVLDGSGRLLHFGGEVMKNVAGYDLFRPMAGALGTLGVLVEVTLKLSPVPACTRTRALPLNPDEARSAMGRLWGGAEPVTATWYDGETLYVRLAGEEPAVARGERRLGGEALPETTTLWRDLREHRLPWFREPGPLWRLSVPPAAPAIRLPGDWGVEWAGAQRWLRSPAEAGAVRHAAAAVGGHATLFRGGARKGEVFHPLDPALLTLHQRLKAVFDPKGIFNPGRLYTQL